MDRDQPHARCRLGVGGCCWSFAHLIHVENVWFLREEEVGWWTTWKRPIKVVAASVRIYWLLNQSTKKYSYRGFPTGRVDDQLSLSGIVSRRAFRRDALRQCSSQSIKPWQCSVAIAELKNMFESEIYSKVSSKLSAFINENRRKMSKDCEEVPIRNCNQHITGFLGSPRPNIILRRGASLEEHLAYLCGSRTYGEDGSMNETAYEGLFSTDRSAQQMCGSADMKHGLVDPADSLHHPKTSGAQKGVRAARKS
ncbi:uncharacterized protein IWZ02DRAFT_243796 [Phyllosticta citriasiana]|uniref:uncharacterized protein n=1 Tax=Phyllosticta citriasiana TaxID=595635 RepID=UPI0030FD7092